MCEVKVLFAIRRDETLPYTTENPDRRKCKMSHVTKESSTCNLVYTSQHWIVIQYSWRLHPRAVYNITLPLSQSCKLRSSKLNKRMWNLLHVLYIHPSSPFELA